MRLNAAPRLWYFSGHSRVALFGGPMVPTLRIRLLGEFALLAGDTPITTINTPRLQSLLAYLVLHRDAPQPRQRLAFLLWPDSSEAQARTNLRHQLHLLRQALPAADDFLDVGVQALQFKSGAPYTLDVADFESALAQATSSPQLQAAVALYRGDLLPDCYDDWVLPERERLSQAFVEAMERLIARLEEEQNYEEAIPYARRLLRYDPVREESHRLLMRLYALNGNRGAALRAYHTCATVLRRELDVEPGPDTQGIYTRLLNAPPAPEPGTPPPRLPMPLSLVGRGKEWSRLMEAWKSALGGRPGMALLTGEAGIGKTRLAEELFTWANRQGVATASAGCYAAEGSPAYAPVVAWLRARPLPEVEPTWLAEVARLLPEVSVHYPYLAAPGPLTEAWQRQRLHEALARTLLAGSTPLLLWIEDLQWCDRETIEWLHYLLRFDPRARLLVLGTVRPGEVTAGHPFEALQAALCRSGQLVEVEVAPLDPAETASLGAQVVGQKLEPEAAALLYRETEGNPLFVVEMARSCQGRRAGTADQDGSVGTALPPPLQSVIGARLAQLSPAAGDLVGLAATIGRDFTFGVLKQASGKDEEALVQALDELWQRRIVREQGQDAYDFGHDKVRQVAYASLSAARRRLLHRRVAEALESIYAGELERASATVAAHYERAGLSQQAVACYRRAAQAAQQVYANEEAVAFLSRALDLTSEQALAERYDLLLARARVFDWTGKREAQARDLAALQGLAELLEDPRRQAEAALLQARYAEATSGYTVAIDSAQRAIVLARQSQAVELEAAGYLLWGQALWQQGNCSEAGRRFGQALAMARAASLAEIEADSLYGLACVATIQDDYPTARHYAGQAHRLYRDAGHRRGEMVVLNVLGLAARSENDQSGAATFFQQALALCREIGLRRNEGALLRNLGGLAHGQGDYARAQDYYEQSLRCCREIGDQRGESETLTCFGSILHDQGDDVAAGAKYRQAVEIAQGVGARREEAFALTCLGGTLVSLDQMAEAAEAYRGARSIQQELGTVNLLLESLAGLAQIALAEGDLPQARTHTEEILGYLVGDMSEPIEAYLACYQVFRATHDPRAVEVIETAYAVLQKQAAGIADEEMRRSFLENYPPNRAVATAWQQRSHPSPL